MRILCFFLIIISAHTFGQNTPEMCTLGIYTNDSAAQNAATSAASVLHPSYVAANPQLCPTANTKPTYGGDPFIPVPIDNNGTMAGGYSAGANLQATGACWVCPVFCNVGWPSHKACLVNSCPAGYSAIDGRCIQYSAAVPEESPPASCDQMAGNPISIVSGIKLQKEIDVDQQREGLVGYHRTFSNATPQKTGFWNNAYQKSLRIVKHNRIDIIRAKSSAYATKEAACNSGFNEIKNQITDNWTQQSTPQYVNDYCQIIKNNKVIKNVAIVEHGKQFEEFSTSGSIQLMRDDGSLLNFGFGPNNEYVSLSGEHGKLSRINNSGTIVWRYTASNGDIENYNADGKLLSITASNGMRQELFYDATSGRLARVKDSTNRELLFAYTGNQISSVTLDGNKTTSYAYNSLGLITTVTRPDNTTRMYHYDDSRFPTYLTGITDERGKRYATWTYDAQGRAISSEHAGGAEKTLLAFNADGSTTVTNALNKKTIYRFDDIAGARRVTKVEGQPTTHCVGANQDYTYTSEGWIASKTDWKGIKTTFTYNTAGQEISRTEAFGTPEARMITTDWHPTLYLKARITEPSTETTFIYDAKGLIKSQTVRSLVLP